jgi:acetylglutamate kinase
MATLYKIGGAPLEDSAYLSALAEHLKALSAPPILVHGGGKAISRLQAAFGIVPRSIGGLRVTDAQTMELAAMALIGNANVNLVATLVKHGVEAQGFHGADRGLLRSRPLRHPEGDLGASAQCIASALKSCIARSPMALCLSSRRLRSPMTAACTTSTPIRRQARSRRRWALMRSFF